LGGVIETHVALFPSAVKVVIPFVQGRLADETRQWGERHRADFVDLTEDDHGYFKLITRLWREGRQFVVVEEDIVPALGQVEAMWACDEQWCAGVHKLHADAPEVWSLGLMRFSSALIERVPVAGLAGAMGQDKRWQRLDLCLYPVIRTGGFADPHLHGPAGRHLGRVTS
jgi:hypothetical protein